MQIKILKRAAKELLDISDYTKEHWSNEQAIKYENLLVNEINLIAQNPQNGRIIKNKYRFKKVESHYIVYRIFANSISIARVLYVKMDLHRHLK